MADLLWIEIIYWAAAILGGTLFILRVIMMLIGGGFGDGDVDIPHDVDIGGDMDTDLSGGHAAADTSFKLLSMQGLTSFFMMFGVVGLALLKSNLPIPVTAIGGTVAGLATVALTGVIFTQMKRLQSEGTINIQNTVGTEGTVYLTIPRDGTGQVQVIVQGSLKIFDAMSKEKKAIATGEKIQVVGVASGNTLIVNKTH